MSVFWDPQSVLNIHPLAQDFTCAGITQRRTGCKQCMFSGADLSKAAQIIITIALLDPASQQVREKLPDLAYLTLCPRWHRKPSHCQVTPTVQRWLRAIAIYCASNTAPSPATSSQTRPLIAVRSVSSTAVRLSEQTRTMRSPSPPSRDIVDGIQAPTAHQRSTSQNPRPVVSSTTPASNVSRPPLPPTSDTTTALPTPPTTPARRNNASALTSLPTNTTTALPTPPATPARHNNTSAATSLPTNTNSSPSQHRDAANNFLILTPSIRAPPASPPTPCSQPHRVRRKPVTEDCAVCLEPICCLDEAVWCRAQCGQNIHRECFAEWRRQSLRHARETRMDEGEEDRLDAVKCVFCRATWKWEWQD